MSFVSQILRQLQKQRAADSTGSGSFIARAGQKMAASSGQAADSTGSGSFIARAGQEMAASMAPPSLDDAARAADAKMQRRLARQRGFASTILAGDLVNDPQTARRGLLGSFQ